MQKDILETTMAGVRRSRTFTVENDKGASISATVVFSFEHITVDQIVDVAMRPSVIAWQAKARGKTPEAIKAMANSIHFIEVPRAPKVVVREKPLSEMGVDELQARLAALMAEVATRT